MKKQITLALGLIVMGAFAQKKELKAVEKAVDNNKFAEAITKSKAFENVMADAKDKYKTKFYFLKAKAFKGLKKYSDANKTFKVLFKLEKDLGSSKYTSKAKPILQNMAQEVSKKALDLYNNKKDYKGAARNFYLTYELSPKDTVFAYNAAIASQQAKDYDGALKYYKELQKINYSGAQIIYYVTDKSGNLINAGSKVQQKMLIKSPEYSKPKDEVIPSKKGEIAKNVALILKEQGKTEEAMKAISDARKSNPKDDTLIFAAAEIYHKLNKMDKYEELMREATKLRPNDAQLFYNLGVVNANEKQVDEAIKYYKKAISIKPNYYEANLNLAAVILSKDAEIIEKINNAIDKNDTASYNKYVKEQKEVYKSSLPYLRKADELNRSLQTVKTLKNIYESLEMNNEAKEYLDLYKAMK